MKDNFRIKKLQIIDGISVWLVDGAHVRAYLEKDFTIAAQHYRFKSIPENEFWIDSTTAKEEIPLLIKHLILEKNLMKKAMSYIKARNKTYQLSTFRKPSDKDFKKKLFHTTKDGIKVWLVDGHLVRSNVHPNFKHGGHDKVYDYIPTKEVWAEYVLKGNELKLLILHELHERELMSKSMSYNTAHKHALKVEETARNNPDFIDTFLRNIGNW